MTLTDKQIRLLHVKYGRDTAYLPAVKDSNTMQQGEIRAKLAEKYGGEVLDFKDVREASHESWEKAQQKAREALAKSYQINFVNPESPRLAEIKKKGSSWRLQEAGADVHTQAEFDRIFKERLKEKVRQMKV